MTSTVATLPLSGLQRSLPCLSLSSYPRSSSSPAMIQVFPPQDLSSTKSNLSPDSSSPIPQISCTPVITPSVDRVTHVYFRGRCGWHHSAYTFRRRLRALFRLPYKPFTSIESKSFPLVMSALFNSISSSTTSHRPRPLLFATSSSTRK